MFFNTNRPVPTTNAHLGWNLQNWSTVHTSPIAHQYYLVWDFLVTSYCIRIYVTYIMGSVAWSSAAYVQKKIIWKSSVLKVFNPHLVLNFNKFSEWLVFFRCTNWATTLQEASRCWSKIHILNCLETLK